MRTHTLLSLALLGLLLSASYIQANDTDADKKTDAEAPAETPEESSEESKEEEAPKKEKTTEIEEEKDVMVLHNINFARALSKNPFLLVEFYAPWCGHCKRLEPEYVKAAEILKKEESVMRLAKVEVTEEVELAEEFEIQGFPTLMLFINGDRKQPVDYTGKRTAESIIKWMKRRSGPGVTFLDTPAAAAQFIDAQTVTIVGFFDSLESEAAKAFVQAAKDMTEAEFGITTNREVFQKYQVKDNSVVLFKKFDEGRADFALTEGKLDIDELKSFISENSLELIMTFNEQNAEKIFTSKVRIHSLLFINTNVTSQTALLDQYRLVAKDFKGKMLFVVIDVTEAMSQVLTYFGVSESDVPTVRIINADTTKKYAIDAGEITENTLRQFSQGVIDGNATPYLRTQEIPEDWNKGPVKVLVGKNFEAVALDPTKNVFVEFYAPWCAHCKELAPIWEKLGEKYADHDDIIIAKMDSTANEVESVTITGFPTLQYFPTGGKQAVDYTGKRDLETMSKFLDDGGVLPKEENDDAADDEEDVEEDDDDTEITETEEEKEPSEPQANKTSKDEL
ncbi:hypothetical protein LDENG_00072730 [Lucifuga dentata]|nr:hypothetical protein LDENG_00072730 [Lucifuga dentata]